MFEIGQIITKQNYTQAAIWCNLNGAHIEKQKGQYVIVANAPAPEPTPAEQVAALEAQTGLTRAVRELVLAENSGELVLAENSGASEYVKSKAREIETLAEPLRTQEAYNDAGTV